MQHAEPDRRHAGGQRDPFADEQFEHALRVEMRTRKHLPGAEQRRRERQPPRVDVEHRDDRQHRVVLADARACREPLRQTSAAPSRDASTARPSDGPVVPDV